MYHRLMVLAILVVSTPSLSFAQDERAPAGQLPKGDSTAVNTVERAGSSKIKLTSAHMKAVLQMYVDHINSGNLQALIGLFADDAIVEDPVGQPLRHGKKEIAELYKEAIESGSKVHLVAPIRGSHGKSAAMAFQVVSGTFIVNVIDVMEFNDQGKIVTMKAYWGPDDIRQHSK